ncbi:MAG: flagellar hook protein FlgE [Geminicoccaceae bacterium]|nr:flagellar hook protein FlgE [Geminicoccaceae bacterium]
MSLFGSLFSGVSGLAAQSKSMGMISDNIANVNTTAYKGTAAHFSSLVTGSQSPTSYSPGGVRSFSQQEVTRQGLIQASDSATDAAISGGGFFVVNSEPLADSIAGEQLYTRAGAFSPDFLGNLVTPSGYYLQGWALDANEEVIDVNTLETVNIAIVNGLATATTNVEVGANLDADQVEYANVPPYDVTLAAAGSVNMASGGVEPHFSRKIQVWDSLGRPQNLTMGFLKTAPNVWEVEVYATDPADVIAPDGLVASGQVSFDGSGTPLANTVAPANITWSVASGADPSNITFDFGTVGEVDGLTQFASPTNVAFVLQNGAEVGELNGVSINEDGYVVAAFTNGEERRLYRLPIATFANPAALDPRSGNVFSQTDASGEFNLRIAGSGGAGRLATSALEAANVDLADEFTKMIVTQRAYSASARVITTTNDMLDELIQISR